MHYSGLEFHFKVCSPESRAQSRFQSASPESSSCLHRSQNARGKLIPDGLPIFILHLVFLLHLALFRLVSLSKQRIFWTFSHCFYKISFCSRVYMYVLEVLLLFTAGHRYHSPCFPLTLASRVTANIVYFQMKANTNTSSRWIHFHGQIWCLLASSGLCRSCT